jgi:hypothetical protein
MSKTIHKTDPRVVAAYKLDPRVVAALDLLYSIKGSSGAALDLLDSIKESSGASKTIYKPHSIGITELSKFSHPGFSNVKSLKHLGHLYGLEELSYSPIYWPPFPRKTLINLAVAGACKSWAN